MKELPVAIRAEEALRLAMRDAAVASLIAPTLKPRFLERHPVASLEQLEGTLTKQLTGEPLLLEEAKVYSKLEDPRFPETRDGCFVAGTLVWTDKGQVPIEKIKVGDMVLSQPEAGGELAYKRVKETFVFESKEIWRIEIYADVHRESITEFELLVTPNHPFWVKGVGWTSVESLKQGDELIYQDGSDGYVNTVDYLFQTRYPGVGHFKDRDAGVNYFVDLRDGRAVWDYGHGPFKLTDSLRDDIFCWRVFNFEVEDFHTYYVGEYGLWVHNTHCAGHKSTTHTSDKGATLELKSWTSRINPISVTLARLL